jgi:hypothetical protein
LARKQLGVFRTEALAHHHARLSRKGDALRLYAFWTRWTYHLLIGILLALLFILCLGRVGEYATGPAVVSVCQPETEAGSQAAEISARSELHSPVTDGSPPADESTCKVMAILPAQVGRQLQPGMPARLAYGHTALSYLTFRIGSITPQIADSEVIRRALGPGLNGSITLPEPAILVEGQLPPSSILTAGRMDADVSVGASTIPATLTVRVRTEPIIFALLPRLRSLLGDHDG